MLNLIRNENMKLYRRPRNRLLLLGIFALITFISIMVWHFSPLSTGDWKTTVANGMFVESDPVTSQVAMMKLGEYRLAHNVAPESYTMWHVTRNVFENAQMFLFIFAVIVAGDIVASEFSTGTIKMLAIRPISRSRILLSKYVASLLFAAACILVYAVTSVLASGLFTKFAGFSTPHLTWSDSAGAVHASHYLIYLIQQSGYLFIDLGLFVTLAFLVSTVFQSSSLAIGISSFLLFFNKIFAVILAMRFSWMKYYLFTNTDLRQFAEGNTPIIKGMTLGSSLLVIAIYFVAMIAITWSIFNRRDIRV